MTLICSSCPNGCELSLSSSNSGTLVAGNYCSKGIAFAIKNAVGFGAPFRQMQDSISLEEANRVLSHWNITADSVKGGAAIQGSPERSMRRTVVQTSCGKFILEQIEQSKVVYREMVAKLLHEIQFSIPSAPYLIGIEGKAVQEEHGLFWMVHPFVEHDQIDRDSFWKDGIFGKQIGTVLVNLTKVCGNLELSRYSSKSYLDKLVLSIGKTRIDVRKSITPILAYLKHTILPDIDYLPLSFSHGDSHPLNMLWKNNDIIALIDWEFCGIRPRIYDTALVLGCIGTESPEAFDSDCIQTILTEMKPIFTELEHRLLGPMIVLNRFNWLSEWLRRHDEEMIEFEIEYMKSLMNRFANQ